MRLLHVDDDARTASAVKRLLEAKGHACETAGSGEDALEQLRGGTYDLILLDLTLPGIDGLDVLRRMQSEAIRVPVLVQSGHDDNEQKVAGLTRQLEELLAKPNGKAQPAAHEAARPESKDDPETAPSPEPDATDRREEPRPGSPVRRQAKRTRMLKSGQIVYNNASCVIECVLKDISDSGARLEVPDMFECPPEVTLRILHGPTHRCSVRWQNGKSIGVEFLDV